MTQQSYKTVFDELIRAFIQCRMILTELSTDLQNILNKSQNKSREEIDGELTLLNGNKECFHQEEDIRQQLYKKLRLSLSLSEEGPVNDLEPSFSSQDYQNLIQEQRNYKSCIERFRMRMSILSSYINHMISQRREILESLQPVQRYRSYTADGHYSDRGSLFVSKRSAIL